MSSHSDPWPQVLHMSAAIRPLAVAIYVAHCRADGIRPVPFAQLPTHLKRFYDERALTLLRDLTHIRQRPTLFEVATHQAKVHRDRVIGRITPETPWGDAVLDPRD